MKCLIICSGGLDSVSMALTHINDDVTFLTFYYGLFFYKNLLRF